MANNDKTTPDGIISIEEYLKKRKRIKQNEGKKYQETENDANYVFRLAELYM